MVRSTLAHPELALPAAHWILSQISVSPNEPLGAVIVGPGGTGKSALLDAVAREYAKSGTCVVRGGTDTAEWLDALDEGNPVLVEDAHRLSEPVLDRLCALAQSDTARLVVTYRPWPRPRGLSALGSKLSKRHSPIMVSHLNRDAISARIAQRFQCTPPQPLIDLVHEQAGGLPWVADLVTAALMDLGRFDPLHPEKFRRPQQVNVSPGLAERLRYQLESLDPQVYGLLQALAVGATLDIEVLAPLLNTDPEQITETVEAARATGLLTESGELIAFIRNLVLRLTPMLNRRQLQRQLAEIQLERGGSVLDAGRQLLGTGATGSRVAAVLEAAGDEALGHSPALAGQFFTDAVDAGSSARMLAARRAQAAMLTGNLDEALRLADAVLSDPDAPDRARGMCVAAAVLAQRGHLARSAQLYRSLPTQATLAVPALIATGALAQARAVLDAPALQGSQTTMLDDAGMLMANGMLASITGESTAALSQLARAAALLEPVGGTTVLPDTPAALTAVVALQCGELAVADSALRRAAAYKLGGRPAHTRHLLLHGWIAMVQGKFDVTHRALNQLNSASVAMEPRDELLASVLAAGLARREENLTALRSQLQRARIALLRHPIDLYMLQPLGELAVAAAECGEPDWIEPHLQEAQALLLALDNPSLWAAPLHWYRLHAALAVSDLPDAQQQAQALANSTHPYGAALAAAAQSWLAITGGKIDAGAVQAAARGLHSVGLAVDGARLAGQAAGATSDRKAMLALLACARSLDERAPTSLEHYPEADPGFADGPPTAKKSEVTNEAATKPPNQAQASQHSTANGSAAKNSAASHSGSKPSERASVLSERELEVGRLVLAGLTYKSIGERLFISAKTVEHHVAKMRQRLGVSSRTELFTALRSLIGEAGVAA